MAKLGLATIVQGAIIQGDSCPRYFCFSKSEIDRGSMGSGFTIAKRGKNQQAQKFPEIRTYNPCDWNLQL